jgi:hypothetical protein
VLDIDKRKGCPTDKKERKRARKNRFKMEK